MNDQTTKRQHYVPQFYLRNFADEEERIHVYDLNEEKFFEPRSDKIGLETYFYDETGEFDNLISDLEGIWSGLIDEIIQFETLEFMTENQSLLFDWFVLFQESRVPEIKAQGQKLVLNMYPKFLKNWSYEETPEHVTKHLEVEDSIDKDKIEDLGGLIDQGKVKFTYFGHKGDMKFSYIRTMVLSDLHRVLVLNNSDICFISSDNPSYLANTYFGDKRKGTGFANKGLQIFFPLTPEIAVLYFDKSCYKLTKSFDKINNRVKLVEGEDIDKLNKMTLLKATRQVYATRSFSKSMLRTYYESFNQEDFQKEVKTEKISADSEKSDFESLDVSTEDYNFLDEKDLTGYEIKTKKYAPDYSFLKEKSGQSFEKNRHPELHKIYMLKRKQVQKKDLEEMIKSFIE